MKEKKSGFMRLDKFLVSQNVGSRKDSGLLVRRGRVRLNEKTEKNPAAKIDPAVCVVWVDGKKVDYSQYTYIMLHKPGGVLSAARDSRAKTVLDLIPADMQRRGLFPAGRLDKDTTGLLIITDDGDYAHKMLSPKKHVYKLYAAVTERAVTAADIEAFAEGVAWKDIAYAPAKLWQEEETAMVRIAEGKFHQVKRMFEATGNKVLKLHRKSIGALHLDPNLRAGECKSLHREEAYLVFDSKMHENSTISF